MDQSNPPDPVPSPAEDQPTRKFTPSVMQGLLGAGATQGSRSPRDWTPPSVEALQQALPQYEVTEFLARGGMGAVYKGMQRALKRPVAIKVLPPEIEDGEAQYAARFKHEAQAMARLSHPNIVAVFDAGEVVLRETGRLGDKETGISGEEGTLLYFVMEFIEGTDVAQLIASEGQLDARRTVQIITAVCDALAFAHEEGIIHRDIKPSNIMIDRKGRVKVADFGLAKTVNLESTMLTGSNVAMGTPDFIAPEALIAGTLVDQRADLYAVGVMLYQMLTGKIPRGRFDAPSRAMPKVDKGFDAIVDKAMQTDRDRRYSTATEMKTDVERVGSSGLATPLRNSPSGTTATDGLKPELRARPRAPLLIGAAVVIVLSAGGWMIWKKTADPASGTVSMSPSLPLSASSSPAPPAPNQAARPGWRKLPPPDAPFLKDSGASINAAGEWITPKGLTLWQVVGRNIAIRGELKWLPGSTEQLKIYARRVRVDESSAVNRIATSRSLVLLPTLAMLQLNNLKPGSQTELEYVPLSRSKLPSGVEVEREWVPFEFALVGDASLGKVAGTPMPVGHSPAGQGTGDIQLNGGQFRKLEYIDLDGVSEGEALQILGVDEKGDVLAGNPNRSKSPSPPVSTASTAVRALSPSTEPWQNVLPVAAKMYLSGEIERVPEGLKVKGPGSIHPPNQQKLDRDGAVRMLWTFGDIRPQLRARLTDGLGGYVLQPRDNGEIWLQGFNDVTKTSTDLRAFEPKEKLIRGQDYELELRATGKTLTAKLNAEVLGTATDETYAEGKFGAGVGTGAGSGSGAPVIIKALEVLHLDKSASSKPTEPAAIKLWDAPEKLPRWLKEASWENNAVKLAPNTALKSDEVLSADLIFRAKVLLSPEVINPQLEARAQNRSTTVDDCYRLGFSEDRRLLILHAVVNEKSVELMRWPLTKEPKADQWIEVEMQLVGADITVKSDGKLLGQVHDTSISGPGKLAIFAKAGGYFRDIEYVPLDKAAATSPSPTGANATAIWKSRWSKPGRLRGLGVDGDGKPIDLSAAGDHVDFVMVSNFAHGTTPDGTRWLALRANGDAIYSDGTVEPGCIGLPQAGNRIMADGTLRLRSGTPPPGPMQAFRASAFEGLPGSRPGVTLWQQLDGMWRAQCTGYEDGTMARPDLSTGAEVKKADAMPYGVGVLRTDGSFRLWGVREIPLAPTAAAGVKDFVTIGRQMVLLRTDGSAWTLSFPEASATDPSPAPTLRPSGTGITAIANGGFSAMFQKTDGTWFPGFTTDAAFTDALAGFKKSGVTHFSAANNNAKISLLWIEPAK